MSEEKIQQLNIIENSLGQIVSQKQQYQKFILEIDTALKEIEGKDEAYSIVGSVMIKKDSKEIKKDLDERKELYTTRITSLEKQEEKLREQATTIREDVIGNLEK